MPVTVSAALKEKLNLELDIRGKNCVKEHDEDPSTISCKAGASFPRARNHQKSPRIPQPPNTHAWKSASSSITGEDLESSAGDTQVGPTTILFFSCFTQVLFPREETLQHCAGFRIVKGHLLSQLKRRCFIKLRT